MNNNILKDALLLNVAITPIAQQYVEACKLKFETATKMPMPEEHLRLLDNAFRDGFLTCNANIDEFKKLLKSINTENEETNDITDPDKTRKQQH